MIPPFGAFVLLRLTFRLLLHHVGLVLRLAVGRRHLHDAVHHDSAHATSPLATSSCSRLLMQFFGGSDLASVHVGPLLIDMTISGQRGVTGAAWTSYPSWLSRLQPECHDVEDGGGRIRSWSSCI
ncbi:hypothetical protein EYF80_022927 [Liparis tanakae]|uniref:Secreted protein n=1 Tax=Liparis tanakae TaxID=230148 RepID=A0A4Z2HLX4_9TELE|nr:hypothetical protein EYF80_022927 [Liparis tanakae]